MKTQTSEDRILQGLQEAEMKAIDSLARYKFVMFGYWAGVWVHLNQLLERRRPNPFASLVKAARDLTPGQVAP